MDAEVVLTPEERLQVVSDTLMASIIGKDKVSLRNRQIMFGQIEPRIFRNENYILYSVLYNFKEQGITPDADFYKMYLLRNEKLILNARDYININAYSDLGETEAVGYVSGVIKAYERLKTLGVLDTEDFKLNLEKFKLEFKNTEMGIVYSKARTVLYDGLQEGRRYYQGYDDSIAFAKKAMADIDSLVCTTSGDGFVDASEYGMRDKDETKSEKIGDFGELKELNNLLGGIYTGIFYSILAPTKGGKSKFTTRMAHNILVEHGNNIVVWAHEGGKDLWLAQLRAIHFDYIYNRNETDVTRMKVGIDQNTIFKGTYPSEAVKELELASRTDLFTNPSYGKLILIDRPFKAETFLDEIETAVQMCNAKAVLVDYLQLIGSDSRNAKKNEYIGKAYQGALAYCKARNVAFISPAQFTQDFIKESSKQTSMRGAETRTAGGESAEIVRTPDINIGLYASVEDLQNHRMQLVSVPSRLCPVFAPIDIYCDLSVCMFSSLDAEEQSA